MDNSKFVSDLASAKPFICPLSLTENETYNQKHKKTSMSYALFLESDSYMRLKLIESGLIPNPNEKNSENLPLLYWTVSGERDAIPDYEWFKKHQKNVFIEYEKETGKSLRDTSSNLLFASLVFSGADPWVEWSAEDVQNTASFYNKRYMMTKNIPTNLMAAAAASENLALVDFLFSHPQSPGISIVDRSYIESPELRSDQYHGHMSLEKTPLIHFLVNHAREGNNYFEILQRFVEKNAEINHIDELGQSPIFYVLCPTVLKYLVSKGAKLDIKNNENKSCPDVWKKRLGTATKIADFNKVFIENMKKSMSPDDLRSLQTIPLFKEVIRGTRGGFDAIYKKSKFSPDVIWSRDDGLQYNLLTASMFNLKGKGSNFIEWCEKNKVDWNFSPIQHPDITNYDVALFHLSSNLPSKVINHFITMAEKETNDVEKKGLALYYKLTKKIKILSDKNFLTPKALCVFHDLSVLAQLGSVSKYLENSRKSYTKPALWNILTNWSSQLGSPDQLSLASDFLKTETYKQTYMSLVHALFSLSVKSIEAGKSISVSHEETDTLYQQFFNLQMDPQEKRNYAWKLLLITLAYRHYDESWGGVIKEKDVREKLLSFVSDEANATITLSEKEVKQISDAMKSLLKKETNHYQKPSDKIPQFMSLLEKRVIQAGLKEIEQEPSEKKKRKI